MNETANTGLPPFEPTLVVDEGTVISIQIKRPKRTKDGDETEPAKAIVAFEFDIDRVDRYLRVLSSLLKRERGVQLGMKFVEQLEHRLAEAAGKNGHGPAPDQGGGLEPIPIASKRGRKKDKAPEPEPAKT